MLCFALFLGILLSDFIPALLKHQVNIAPVGARPGGRDWRPEATLAELEPCKAETRPTTAMTWP